MTRLLVGVVAGFLAPVIIGLIVYLFSTGDKSLGEYTEIGSLCRYHYSYYFTVCIS